MLRCNTEHIGIGYGFGHPVVQEDCSSWAQHSPKATRKLLYSTHIEPLHSGLHYFYENRTKLALLLADEQSACRWVERDDVNRTKPLLRSPGKALQ